MTTLLAVAFSLAICIPVAGVTLVAAQTAQDPSEVVLVFDVSDSILDSDDGTNVEFAAALDDIADRVEAIADDLAVGNATVSFVAFGRTARPYPGGCQRLELNADPAAVTRFEECLRRVSAEYAAGSDAPVKQRINTAGTDHVAALVEAEDLLSDLSSRSAVIFFTDGEHDPPGTSRDGENVVARVRPAFEGRAPLAVVPVGLGAEAGDFESDLRAIYDAFLRDMAPCEGRPAFSWPEVVFPSGIEAGAAVALALQEVTCSFTVAPTLPPPPTSLPTSLPTPAGSPVPATPPTITPVPVDPGPPPPTCGGFFDCNPWALPALSALAIAALLGAVLIAARRYVSRNRIWVTVQVDGGANRSLGWGHEHGLGLDHDDAGWSASSRPIGTAPIRIRYTGKNRFLVQSAAGIRDVHQGDPAPIRVGTGEIHSLIVRLYRKQPREMSATPRAPDAAGGNALGARIDGGDAGSANGDAASTPGEDGRTPG